MSDGIQYYGVRKCSAKQGHMRTCCYFTERSGKAFLTIPGSSDCPDSSEGEEGEPHGYLLEGHSRREWQVESQHER